MTNPFDDEQHRFFVLIKHEGQHSLWPQFAQIYTLSLHDALPIWKSVV